MDVKRPSKNVGKAFIHLEEKAIVGKVWFWSFCYYAMFRHCCTFSGMLSEL